MLGKALLLMTFVMIIGKIYQHNKMIQYSYKKQRIDGTRKTLLREYDALMITYAELTDYRKVQSFAQNSMGMTSLPLSHVVTITGFTERYDGKQI